MAKKQNYTAVPAVIGPVRLSYPYLFSPYTDADTSISTYRADVLIPKSDTELVAKVKEAINKAIPADAIKDGKLASNFNIPLKDGDEKEKDANNYAGHLFLAPKSKAEYPPRLLKKVHGSYIPATEDDIYSGCWVYVEVNFKAYSTTGNRGISVFLQSVLKYKDDTPFGGGGIRLAPETAFADVAIPDDAAPAVTPAAPAAPDDDAFPF